MALPAQALPNIVVGNYRILERIASGGMGVVYKAFDLSLQRTVALKFLSPDHTPNATERDRLLREARAASVLDHENIAAIHRVGETEDSRLFIDMGYYEGEDLATRMRRTPPKFAQALDIVAQVARGLAHAHAHGVIHRDIKPANVILTQEGVAKIVDFGLARFVSPDASTLSLNLTGTLLYMSPEQLTGKSLDARTDIWSLGVILYELLAQHHPFGGDSTAALLNSILNCEPEKLKELPDQFQTIINRALKKDPAQRYQTSVEFLRDIERMSGGEHATHEQRSFAPSKGGWISRRPSVRWAITIAFVLGVAMLRPTKVNDRQPHPPAAAPAPNELYQQGLALLERYDKEKNLKGAIEKFEQTTKADPSFALAYAALAEAYVDKYRQELNPDWLKRAEEYCQTAIRLNDQLAEVHVTLGRIHVLSGKHDLGQQEIMHALKLDPRNVKGLLALGDAYAKVSRNSEAEQAYAKAIALRPDNWDAYQRRGSYYFLTKRYDLAAKQYRRVIALVPDQASAHSNLAAALFQMGKDAEAEKEMKESLRLAPTYAAYYNLAWRYYTQKRFAEAVAIAELASELNADDYNVWQMLGLSYEWTGQPEKANAAYQRELSALQKAAPLKSEDATAQAELGLLYSKLRQKENAMTHLQTALALEPENPEVLALVGESYENFSDRTQALAHIERAIQKGWDIGRLYNNPDLRQFLKDPQVQDRLRKTNRGRAKPGSGKKE